MVFKSLDELVAYTKNKIAASMPEVGKEMKEIMKEEVNKQVYSGYTPVGEWNPNVWGGRTGQLLDAIDVTELSSNSVTSEIQNNGNWVDAFTRNSAFPMERLEKGKVWGVGGYRPQTNIMEESNSKAQERVPKCFKSKMNELGVPVK
ncbi:TPA: hypothetical protein P1M42_000017 [Clostridioides difficile]|uniref:Uncharacterized protein n=1 Tax=Clostridioides difficile ATCC 9689 = DSM 1296 TaxID=1121308 RepID=A0ACA7UTA7_CLODI|nr:hypothetical protein [Clostridioides difficile]YP_009221611.1 hypothetical protein PHICD211_20016 [Clostridium phage phiCD211]AKP44690.1 hypothetical protein CDIF1296T_phi016 [Peptoclostridium phage phiCDIF1296T]CCL66953.1 hypothetical protein BN183_3680010 [Clostridioides difficile E7]ARC17039.1 hypothetical protein A6J95_20010 [Clostridioides difficile]AVI14357.1 hypothetical protein C4J70_19205 [Clostridioides difficile]EGT3640560.1 hypothetical protein [Clostridioides difficile]